MLTAFSPFLTLIVILITRIRSFDEWDELLKHACSKHAVSDYPTICMWLGCKTHRNTRSRPSLMRHFQVIPLLDLFNDLYLHTVGYLFVFSLLVYFLVVYLFICLFVCCLFVYLFVSLLVCCLFVYPFICLLFICLSVC